ncbi:MAG: DUF3168 domain-containing protein [Candidatus Hydrogenedentota bacterium]|nr:MAG: DUF3168 domain-containing protein [Candidatus Hydrogenedentota bacterium]
MKSPTLALHLAQVTRIEAQTSYKVFDDMPEQEPDDYIVMGEVTARDWSDKFEPGQEVYSTIHIWSRYAGRKKADEMADGILQALTLSPLDLSPNFRAVLDGDDIFDSYDLIIDIDGVTRHGILKMKYLIEEVST